VCSCEISSYDVASNTICRASTAEVAAFPHTARGQQPRHRRGVAVVAGGVQCLGAKPHTVCESLCGRGREGAHIQLMFQGSRNP